ncbi:MAG TPA: class I SAM-dependent methyltransferase [Bryobacteraceae bacterium]|nr:class I SAM-dependent methyltransferase [Bryobacteraceae bacterium]
MRPRILSAVLRGERFQLASQVRLWIKGLLFPGLDMNLQCRYRFLPTFFRKGPIDTLDAGCGNGALSLAACQLGNRVLGVTFSQDEVKRNREFFSGRPDIAQGQLQFDVCNIYELRKLGRQFDQIICSETLEHIARDAEVIGILYDMLRPGGVLHVCCPYALHPFNNQGRVNGPEDGGHVRDGYTIESYRKLLEPAGFRIDAQAGLGSRFLLRLDRTIRFLRNHLGEAAAIPIFLLLRPLQGFDRLNPPVPYSIYVRAIK